MNKYIFFREYYKPICIAPYDSDERAEVEAQKLANELGELVIVCRHLTQRAGDGAKTSAERALKSAKEATQMLGAGKSPRA